METKIAVVETNLKNLMKNFERQVGDHRSLRSTFTNVTIGLVSLIFGVLFAYAGGLYWTTDKQISLAKQQTEIAKQQGELSDQQNDIHQEMGEIKTQLVKINKSMDIILKEHASFHK